MTQFGLSQHRILGGSIGYVMRGYVNKTDINKTSHLAKSFCEYADLRTTNIKIKTAIVCCLWCAVTKFRHFHKLSAVPSHMTLSSSENTSPEQTFMVWSAFCFLLTEKKQKMPTHFLENLQSSQRKRAWSKMGNLWYV